MKLIQTGLPRRLARSIVPPPTSGTTSGGAAWPTWNGASAALADGLGERVAAAVAVADATDGTLVAAALDATGPDERYGSGANAKSPPSSSPAAAIPTSRPAMIDKRANMDRAYQYERTEAFWKTRCYDARPMADLANRIRTRVIPAFLTALGIAFLAAGLMSITSPVTADSPATPSPSPVIAVVSTPAPRITLPPIGSGGPPSASPTIPADRVVTRVRVAALDIDLPVIRASGVPCNVALEYVDRRLGAPGEGRAIYLYSHAQTGMFLPLLTQSKLSNGKKMLGMVVEAWTNDDQRFLYVITQVRRHVSYLEFLRRPTAAKSEELWLQTSEGAGTEDKLQVVAEPLSQGTADHSEANPKPRPRDPTKVKSGGVIRELC